MVHFFRQIGGPHKAVHNENSFTMAHHGDVCYHLHVFGGPYLRIN